MNKLGTNETLRRLVARLNETEVPVERLFETFLVCSTDPDRGNVQGDLVYTLAQMKLNQALSYPEFGRCWQYPDVDISFGDYKLVSREKGLVVVRREVEKVEYDGIVFVENLPVAVEIKAGRYKRDDGSRELVSGRKLTRLDYLTEIFGGQSGMILFLPDDQYTNAINQPPLSSNLQRFEAMGGQVVRLGIILSAIQGGADRIAQYVTPVRAYRPNGVYKGKG